MNRILALDVFRGITVILMIIVNILGGHTAYTWLDHSAWDGCTIADIVFPFFLLIAGTSIPFQKPVIAAILRKAIILFAVGLLLNAYPNHWHFADLRLLGVLQRIAICYFLGAIIYLTTTARTQIFIVITILISYYLAMTLWPYGNLAEYIDSLFISANHLYHHSFDPEGLFSTIPALATTLIGCLLGSWLRSNHNAGKKFFYILGVGIILCILGQIWSLQFPINKALWSSSYVLWTGGLGLIIFASCYALIDIKLYKFWTKPFEFFGKNALSTYILHVGILKTVFLFL